MGGAYSFCKTDHGETGEYVFDEDWYSDGLFEITKGDRVNSEAGL